jgi:hypothetical protein
MGKFKDEITSYREKVFRIMFSQFELLKLQLQLHVVDLILYFP